jgi:hypothetical protein
MARRSRHVIYVTKLYEVGKEDGLTNYLGYIVLNLNSIAQIRKYFSYHTIRTVPVFFVVLFRTSDPTATNSSRLSAPPGYTSK